MLFKGNLLRLVTFVILYAAAAVFLVLLPIYASTENA